MYQLHNETYLFGRTEAYTTAISACSNLDGYLHRWCKGGGEWSDQLFDSCKYHCEQETKLNKHDEKQYSFAKTEAGKTARSPCKSDLGGYVYRSCDKGGKWSDKISHQCNTPMTEDINEVRNIVNSGGVSIYINKPEHAPGYQGLLKILSEKKALPQTTGRQESWKLIRS